MDKLSKAILKDLTSVAPDPAAAFYDWETDLEKLAARVGAPVETVRAAIRYLHEEHYVEYLYNQHGRDCGFQLGHKGIHYTESNRETKRKVRKDYWLGVVSGVLISVISQLFINLVVKLLSQ